ncbi:hypothetical protein PENSPDRAFT_413392 [Peniophora sp. CONT]|nr:hypothetical protein PENSPDRAFT_413392 [Peniophora sp. CONT]
MTAYRNERVNLETPIARLPAEVLRMIVQYDVRYYTRSGPSPDVRTVRKWLRLGQVCRSWRRSTFNMSDVWATILFGVGHRKATDVLMPLTRAAPLNLEMAKGLKISSTVYKELAVLAPRAWRISYSCSTKKDGDRFAKLLANPLPHLHTVSLASSTGLPITAMAEHVNLRALEFHGVFMRPPIQARLLHLDVLFFDSTACWQGRIPDIPTILDVLSNARTLKTLSLYWHYEGDSAEKTCPTGPRVVLPYLTDMRMGFLPASSDRPGMLSMLFLDNVHTPRLDKLKMMGSYMYRNVQDTSRALSSIARAWAPPLPVEYDAVNTTTPLVVTFDKKIGATLGDVDGELSRLWNMPQQDVPGVHIVRLPVERSWEAVYSLRRSV